MESNKGFPLHTINPAYKGDKWIKDYCKAAWQNSGSSFNMFYNNRWVYDEIMSYAYGYQSDVKYRRLLKTDEDKDSSWMAIDYRILGILAQHRRMAIARLLENEYEMIATPVDDGSAKEINTYWAKIKAKLIMKQQLAQTGLAGAIKQEPQEPQNLDDLNMRIKFGDDNQAAIEAEEGLELIFYKNDLEGQKKLIIEDLVDKGVAAYKDWIDDNGNPRFRRVDPRRVICSYSETGEFNEIQYFGELKEMTIGELKVIAGKKFTSDEYDQIASQAGKLGFGEKRDTDKIRYLDIEFFSYNTSVKRQSQSPEGNVVFKNAKYDNLTSEDKSIIDGEQVPKYIGKTIQVVYCGKWIIDTDFIFDCGLATDMKRNPSDMSNTALSYNAYAPEFFDMRALGITEQMIPMEDQIQIAWYRLQNSLNKVIPKGWGFDVSRLEAVATGQGGLNMTPLQLLDYWAKTGIYVYRGLDLQDGQPSQNPGLTVMENGMGSEITGYWEIIINNIELIKKIAGLNELTDGSTPDARMNKLGQQSAIQSTNNSLKFVTIGEKKLRLKLSKSLLLRLQDARQKGEVKGYVPKLGKIVNVPESISKREYNLKLTEVITTEERQLLMSHVEKYLGTGELDPSDSVLIMRTQNLKKAEDMLAYKVEKRREQNQANAMQQQQGNADVQIQSAQAAEQAKQQTLSVAHDFKMQEIDKTKEWEYKIAELTATKRADDIIAQETNKVLLTSMGIASDHVMQGNEQEAAELTDAG